MRLRDPVPNPLKLCQCFGPPDIGVLAGRVYASYQFYLQARHQRPEKKTLTKKNFQASQRQLHDLMIIDMLKRFFLWQVSK